MKNILLFFFAITTPFLSFLNKTDDSKFIGRWSGDDKSSIGYVNFDNEGYASFEIEGEVFGGKEFVFEGQKSRITYEINYKTNPIEVDFIVTILQSDVEKRLLCIANFIDSNTMEFAIGFDGTRPTEFDSENSIILERE